MHRYLPVYQCFCKSHNDLRKYFPIYPAKFLGESNSMIRPSCNGQTIGRDKEGPGHQMRQERTGQEKKGEYKLLRK